MCILPMFSQKRICGDWTLEIDCRLMKFDQCPISAVLDQLITMLKRSERTNDQDARDFIFRNLGNREGERE